MVEEVNKVSFSAPKNLGLANACSATIKELKSAMGWFHFMP